MDVHVHTIYILIYIHTCVHVTHMYIQNSTYIQYTCMHTQHTHVHAKNAHSSNTYVHTCTHIYKHIYTREHTLSHSTNMNTHMYTHMKYTFLCFWVTSLSVALAFTSCLAIILLHLLTVQVV